MKVIVVFRKMEEAKNIKTVLIHNGVEVMATGTSGAFAISAAEELDNGIIICGYRLTDMTFMELKECLPNGFRILLVTSETHWMNLEDKEVVFLPIPLRVHALVETVHMMIATSRNRRHTRMTAPRSEEHQQLIKKAKGVLMERNSMTEDEAHRYLQKCSMDSGNSLVETAHMVMSIYG